MHSTHLRTAAVGGLVGIGGRERADRFRALWAAGLPLLKIVVHGPDRKNGLVLETQRANISGYGTIVRHKRRSTCLHRDQWRQEHEVSKDDRRAAKLRAIFLIAYHFRTCPSVPLWLGYQLAPA